MACVPPFYRGEIIYNWIYQCVKNPRLLRLLPYIPLMWRLIAAENIILSGFQLELYAPHERTFAYWYLTQVIETHLGCIEDVLGALPSGVSPVGRKAWRVDRHYRHDRTPRNEIPSHITHRIASFGYWDDSGRCSPFRRLHVRDSQSLPLVIGKGRCWVEN